MTKDLYNKIYNEELHSDTMDWSFSIEMQKASRNSMWVNKIGLWSFLSAACDEAASKCYQHINKFSQSLIDVDTCNIHALKSIAESVDLGYLCKKISEDYPEDIMNLMNIFSIPKHYLLYRHDFISDSSNNLLFGKIAERASKEEDDDLSIDLLANIKKNIYDIKNILNRNMIFTSHQLYKRFKSNLKDLDVSLTEDSLIVELTEMCNKHPEFNIDTESLYFLENLTDDLNKIINDNFYIDSQKADAAKIIEKYNNSIVILDILNTTLDDVLININNIQDDSDDYSILNYYKEQSLFVTINAKKQINWFYILINVIKQNLYNEEFNFFIEPNYFNKEQNIIIDLSPLFSEIINVISFNNKKYVESFICYHFYNLISSKLKNEVLKKIVKYDNNKSSFIINKEFLNEYSEDEFKASLTDYLTYEEIEELLNPLYVNDDNEEVLLNINVNLNNYLIDFAKYLKIANNFIWKYNKANNENCPIIEYNVIKINYPEVKCFANNNYEMQLFGSIDNPEHESIVMKMAKEFTNICINISLIREQIKTSIQQYNFIGTKRIATDVLADFFLKNFSKDSDWNYLNTYTSGDVEITDSFSSLSSLLNSFDVDKSFSIDVVEYYDTTNYLNIESEMGQAKIGEYVARVDEVPRYFIDSNNLIASSIVSANVYEDIYVPCSYFFKNYNKKFWETAQTIIGYDNNKSFGDEINFENYDNFFEQYIPEYKIITDKDTRKRYINSVLDPIIKEVWETFALSGYDANYIGDLKELFDEYIGNDNGTNKYKNVANTYFPTIAAMQNIDGLVEITKNEDSNIMFLCKFYYANVINNVISASRKILNMHDENGVPYEGWRQQYVNFHGYTTYYEASDNRSIFISEPRKYFDFDGPWSYSYLQKVIFNKLQGETKFSFIGEYIDIENKKKFDLMKIYHYYINDENLFTSGNKFAIGQIENDIHENVFTSFDEIGDGKITKRIYFRSYDMPLSLPLMHIDDHIEYDFLELNSSSNLDIIRTVVNNCIKFGIVENTMWIFGAVNDVYKLVTFKYEYQLNHIIVDNDSIKYYDNNNFSNCLNSINDLVDVIFNQDDKSLNIFTFNTLEMLYEIGTYDQEKIREQLQEIENRVSGFIPVPLKNSYTFDMPITAYKLNIDTNNLTVNTIIVKNAKIPSVLKTDDSNELDESHSIWRAEEYDRRYYFCYEALSDYAIIKEPNAFYEYYNFKKDILKFEKIKIEYKLNNFYLNQTYDGNILDNSKFLKIYVSEKPDRIFFNKAISDSEKADLIVRKMKEYPKCYEKNGSFFIELIALTFKNSIDDSLMKDVFIMNLISDETIKQELSTDGFTFTFDFMNRNFNLFSENYKNLLLQSSKVQTIKNDLDVYKKQLEFIIENIEDLEKTDSVKLTFNSKEQEEEMNLPNSLFLSNEVYENIPIMTKCLVDKLKIVVWFKNTTGVTFIGDHALDLDLICYINDAQEVQFPVGYWSRYRKSKYISWGGDNTKGEYEYLEIDMQKYKLEKAELMKNVDNIKIVLNTCWHYNSEIMHDDVYVTVSYGNVSQNIKVDLVGLSEKACATRSLEFNYNLKTDILTYEQPMLYYAVKLTLKDEVVGIKDGIPDIKVGLVNLTKSEIERKEADVDNWTTFDDMLISLNYEKSYNEMADDYIYATILFKNDPITIVDDVVGKKMIINKLKKIFNVWIRNLRVNYKDLVENDIYFGYYADNIDKNTNFNYIYYSFAKPRFFTGRYILPEGTPQILNVVNKSIKQRLIDLWSSYSIVKK